MVTWSDRGSICCTTGCPRVSGRYPRLIRGTEGARQINNPAGRLIIHARLVNGKRLHGGIVRGKRSKWSWIFWIRQLSRLLIRASINPTDFPFDVWKKKYEFHVSSVSNWRSPLPSSSFSWCNTFTRFHLGEL